MSVEFRAAEPRISPTGLLLCGVMIGPIAFAVHSDMIDVLHIPFPQDGAVPTWATYLNVAGSTIANFVFARLAWHKLGQLHFPMRLLVVAAIYLALRATLRLFLVNMYVTTYWVFPALTALPRIILFCAICTAVVFLTPRLSSTLEKVGAGAVVALAALLAVKPFLDWAFAPAFKALSAFDLPEFHKAPYTLQDNIVFYCTYYETVAAAFAIAYLAWPRLSSRPTLRLFQFVLLVMFMKQSVFPTVLFSFWIDAPWPQAVLSEGQFGLETLALALLTGLAWPLCQIPMSRSEVRRT